MYQIRFEINSETIECLGWYRGERIRDGEKGWFPGNYTSEIASQHARAKNLKQRYRLLAMSGSYLQSQQDKVKKK